jgi:hypothetical protein
MLCYVTSFDVMSYYVISCYPMLCYVMLYYVMLFCVHISFSAGRTENERMRDILPSFPCIHRDRYRALPTHHYSDHPSYIARMSNDDGSKTYSIKDHIYDPITCWMLLSQSTRSFTCIFLVTFPAPAWQIFLGRFLSSTAVLMLDRNIAYDLRRLHFDSRV